MRGNNEGERILEIKNIVLFPECRELLNRYAGAPIMMKMLK